jgi:hypothetical protein
MSLKAALEELGFGPCYHMSEVFEHPEHVPLWEAATRGERVDWEEIFQDYRATTDWPGGAFYKELMQRYPNAKVILTVRHPEKWYESARSTIYGIRRLASSPLFSLAAVFVPRLKRLRRTGRMITALAWEGTFHGRFEDREYAIKVFERWNEEVKKCVPAQRLLVYEVKEGWAPLCEFLEVQPPQSEPFPHLNDAETFQRRIRRSHVLSVAVPTVAVITVGAALEGLALLRSRTVEV